jgi:hypothetical protein
MAIWFEVSGFRCQETFSVTIFYIFRNPPRPYIVFVKIILEQLYRSFKRLWRSYLADHGSYSLFSLLYALSRDSRPLSADL